MKTPGIQQAKAFIAAKTLKYAPKSVMIKTIIRKTTGNVSAISYDSGEAITQEISPFATFIQIIEGKAEIAIDGTSNMLHTGQSIIVPAHSPTTIKANERFKMISIIIKSGYDI